MFFNRKDLRYQQKRMVERWMIRRHFNGRDGHCMYNEKPQTDATSGKNEPGSMTKLVKSIEKIFDKE